MRRTVASSAMALAPFSQNSKWVVSAGSGQAQPGQSNPSGWLSFSSVLADRAGTELIAGVPQRRQHAGNPGRHLLARPDPQASLVIPIVVARRRGRRPFYPLTRPVRYPVLARAPTEVTEPQAVVGLAPHDRAESGGPRPVGDDGRPWLRSTFPARPTRTREGPSCSRTCRSASVRASTWRSSAPTGSASPRCCTASSATYPLDAGQIRADATVALMPQSIGTGEDACHHRARVARAVRPVADPRRRPGPRRGRVRQPRRTHRRTPAPRSPPPTSTGPRSAATTRRAALGRGVHLGARPLARRVRRPTHLQGVRRPAQAPRARIAAGVRRRDPAARRARQLPRHPRQALARAASSSSPRRPSCSSATTASCWPRPPTRWSPSRATAPGPTPAAGPPTTTPAPPATSPWATPSPAGTPRSAASSTCSRR